MEGAVAIYHTPEASNKLKHGWSMPKVNHKHIGSTHLKEKETHCWSNCDGEEVYLPLSVFVCIGVHVFICE